MISQCFVEALQERKGKFLIAISTKMKIGKSWEILVLQHFLIGKQSINDILHKQNFKKHNYTL